MATGPRFTVLTEVDEEAEHDCEIGCEVGHDKSLNF